MRGNPCLLFFQRISNILLLLVSLAFAGVGAWLLWETHYPGLFEVGFIILGAMEFFFSLIGLYSKKSKTGMVCFMWLLGSICVIQIITAAMAYGYRQQILNDAESGLNEDAAAWARVQGLIEDNVNAATIVGLAVSGVQILCFFFTWFYVCSLKRLKGRHSDRLMSDAYNDLDYQVMLDQKQAKDKEEIKAKYDDKRKKMQEMVDLLTL